MADRQDWLDGGVRPDGVSNINDLIDVCISPQGAGKQLRLFHESTE